MVKDQVLARQRILEIQCYVRNKVRARLVLHNEDCCRWHFFDLSQVSDMHASAVPAKKHSVYLQGRSRTLDLTVAFKAANFQKLVCAMAV